MAQNLLLPLVTRTASVNTGWQTPSSFERGAHFIINITAAAGSGETLTFRIQGRDVLGNVYTLLTSAAITATGILVLQVHPDVTAVTNVAAKDFLPDEWRVSVTNSASGNWTYSICTNTKN